MEGAEINIANCKFSLRMKELSRDPLLNLQSRCPNAYQLEADSEELELSLGLSMNGRFGVDPKTKKIKRTSSVSNLSLAVGNGSSQQAPGMPLGRYELLARAHSLPIEAEEWCRRKEFQSERRMEARKRSMRKHEENCFQDVSNGKKLHGVAEGSLNGFDQNGNVTSSSRGPAGCPNGGSSVASDHLSLQIKGGTLNAEVPPSSQCLQEQGEQGPAARAASRDVKANKELPRNPMLDMPYVTTKKCGPNGRCVEGFLYRYKKGEEVIILCVCHGMFLSAAEFVKHGGLGEVEHPVKHIVVNPHRFA